MRLTLPNLPQIEALSQPLAQTLSAITAAIRSGWMKQHTGDGAHAGITADSLAVSGATTLGALTLSQVEYIEPGGTGGTVNDITCEGLATASCLRIVPTSSPLQINGIDATGRAPGSLLLVLNCDYTLSPVDVWLSTENTGSQAANRFAQTLASPGGGAGGPVIINGARGLWLCYDWQQTSSVNGARNPRWRIIDPTS